MIYLQPTKIDTLSSDELHLLAVESLDKLLLNKRGNMKEILRIESKVKKEYDFNLGNGNTTKIDVDVDNTRDYVIFELPNDEEISINTNELIELCDKLRR